MLSVARWLLIVGTIERILDEGLYKIKYRAGDTKEKLFKSIIHGFFNAEKQYNKLSHTDYNCIKETVNSTDYSDYVTALERNWVNLSRKLNIFSRLQFYN